MKLPRKIDIVTANLFSELLIEILPKLKHVRRLVFSGILREQAEECIAAFRAQGFKIERRSTRGKWVAALAKKC